MCSETIYVTNVYFKCIICFIIQAWQHLWDNVFINYFIRRWIYSQQNTDVSRSEPKRSMLCRIVGALRHSCLLGPPTSVTCLRCTTCILLYVIIQVLACFENLLGLLKLHRIDKRQRFLTTNVWHGYWSSINVQWWLLVRYYILYIHGKNFEVFCMQLWGFSSRFSILKCLQFHASLYVFNYD